MMTLIFTVTGTQWKFQNGIYIYICSYMYIFHSCEHVFCLYVCVSVCVCVWVCIVIFLGGYYSPNWSLSRQYQPDSKDKKNSNGFFTGIWENRRMDGMLNIEQYQFKLQTACGPCGNGIICNSRSSIYTERSKSEPSSRGLKE